jgi:hypothetical protein
MEASTMDPASWPPDFVVVEVHCTPLDQLLIPVAPVDALAAKFDDDMRPRLIQVEGRGRIRGICESEHGPVS